MRAIKLRQLRSDRITTKRGRTTPSNDLNSTHKHKAISISGSRGETYYQRAEVYFSVAESCSGDPIQFWDKIVYEISWKDYQTAVNKGYKQAKARRDFLKENYITTSSDWFMRPEGETEVSPERDCYAWIDKTVKRKK